MRKRAATRSATKGANSSRSTARIPREGDAVLIDEAETLLLRASRTGAEADRYLQDTLAEITIE